MGNCESVLLSTNMDMVGTGVNGGDCLNTNQKACESSKNVGLLLYAEAVVSKGLWNHWNQMNALSNTMMKTLME